MPTQRLPCAAFAKPLRANHNLGMSRRDGPQYWPGQQDLNLVRRAA